MCPARPHLTKGHQDSEAQVDIVVEIVEAWQATVKGREADQFQLGARTHPTERLARGTRATIHNPARNTETFIYFRCSAVLGEVVRLHIREAVEAVEGQS